jgi:hypothetical protein
MKQVCEVITRKPCLLTFRFINIPVPSRTYISNKKFQNNAGQKFKSVGQDLDPDPGKISSILATLESRAGACNHTVDTLHKNVRLELNKNIFLEL